MAKKAVERALVISGGTARLLEPWVGIAVRVSKTLVLELTFQKLRNEYFTTNLVSSHNMDALWAFHVPRQRA